MSLRINKEHNCKSFILWFSVLAAMIFIRYGLQIGIPRELALIPIAVIALKGDLTEIISICMCLIPFHESLDFYLALILVLTLYVLRFYERIKINAAFFLLLLMLLWELFHCFWVDFSPFDFVTSVLPIIAFTIIVCSDLKELDYGFTVRSVAAAALVTCVTMLIQVAWLSGFKLINFMLNLRRLGAMSEASIERLSISGGMVNTNSLGVICVIIIAAFLLLRSSGLNNKSDNLIIVTLLVFGALTSSRTFLVCLLLMAVLMLFSQKGGMKKLRYIGVATLCLAWVLIIMGAFFPDQLEYYISRFFEKDITTGRESLMVSYHKFITENPDVMLFGIGLQNFGERLVSYYRAGNHVPHNCIQEIIAAWGIPGLILMISTIAFTVIKAVKHTRNVRLINYIPLIIILFKSAAGQLLTSNYTLLALGFAYITLIQDINKNLPEEN